MRIMTYDVTSNKTSVNCKTLPLANEIKNQMLAGGQVGVKIIPKLIEIVPFDPASKD